MHFVNDFFEFASKRSGVPVQQPIDEQQGFVEKSLQKQLAKNCQASLKAINADLASAEKQINTLIQSDERLKELFGWITARPLGLCAETIPRLD
jgi:small-conductance mechanosensitive channel